MVTPSPLRACGAGGAQRKSRATEGGVLCDSWPQQSCSLCSGPGLRPPRVLREHTGTLALRWRPTMAAFLPGSLRQGLAIGTKRYSIRMSTGRSEPAGCTGEVTATGTLIGTAIMAAASDGSDCKLAITFSAALCESANRATASPSEGCSATSAAISSAREAAVEQSPFPPQWALKPAQKRSLQHLRE